MFKKFLLAILLILFACMANGGVLDFDRDIKPAYDKMESFFGSNNSNGCLKKLVIAYTYSTPEDTPFMARMAVAVRMICAEVYAVQYYGLTNEYKQFLLSDSFNKACEEISAKGKHKAGFDFQSTILDIFGKAMKTKSARLGKIYSSSRYMEASICVGKSFGKDDKPKKQKDAVSDLMLYKEIITRRVNEAQEGFYPLNFKATMSQVALDLRAYYRNSDCPDDVASAFSDYLSALDAMVMTMENQPRDVSSEEALATVLLWTIAGGNPLDPARIDMAHKNQWSTRMQHNIEQLSNAENRLNKVCIKYGLRL